MASQAQSAPEGREREFLALSDCVRQAGVGRGQTVLLHGPAGIGKTTVLRAAAQDARQNGWTVLQARGSEAERDIPYGIVRALLEAAVTSDGGLLEGAARHARSALLDPEDAGPGGDDHSHAVLRGLFWVVARMAQQGPLMLAIDDVHWADNASHRFLDTLRVRLDGLPVLLLAVTRDGAGENMEHWFADATVRALSLPPLGPEAVDHLVRTRLPQADDAVCAACALATGGNPFLLAALIDDLAMRPSPLRADDVGAITPDAAVRAIGVRLRGLGEDAGHLARAAAVLGGPLNQGRAARMAGLDPARAPAAVTALVRAGLLVESDGQLAFPHPLMLSAVRESAGPVERVRLSGAAGRLLAGEHGELDRACAHLLTAEPAADPDVVDALVRGAVAARTRGAPAQARRLLHRALAEPPPLSRRGEIAGQMLDAAFGAGHAGIADDAALVFELTDDPATRLRAAITLGHVLTLTGDAAAGIRVVREHLAPGVPPALAADAEGLVTAWSTMQLAARDLARPELAQLLPLAGTADAPLELVSIASLEAVISGRPATEVLALAQRATAGGELLRRHGPGTPIPTAPIFAAAHAGGYALAERIADDVLAAARGQGSLVGECAAIGGRGIARTLRGEVSGGEADLRTALELEGDGHGFGIVSALVVEALSRCLRVTSGPAAAALVLERLAPAAQSPESMSGVRWLAERARVALAEGRPADALAGAERLAHFDERWPSTGAWTGSAAIRAWALTALGDAAGAGAAAAAALVVARAFGAPHALVDALRVSSALDHGSGGDALIEEARQLCFRAGLVIDEIEVLLDIGTRHLAAGRDDEARRMLGDAAGRAELAGAEALAKRLQLAAVAAGARPRRVSRTGVGSLTPAERRTAELAAAGQTNRQVAEALFLTEKTVENHLTSVYRKLYLRSRVELRDALAG